MFAQAGTLLSAPLNYETRLSNVAHLAVPDMADWCAIDVVDSQGSLRRLAVAHIDPVKIGLAHELQRRYPPEPDDRSGIYEVLRTGQSQVYADIPNSQLEATIKNPEQLALVRQLGLTSVMIVPMVARGRTLGAITFAWAESGRRYGPIDLAMAEELARRTALAMDNALLYAEAQQLNAELERRVAERTAQVEVVKARLINEIAERRQAEEQVRILNAELEQRVAERTAQLEIVNRDLKNEVLERQRVGKALRAVLKRTRELYRISQTIGTVRTADEVLHALLSSSYLTTASRASIALFDAPWLDDDHLPQRCDILAAWNKDADLPASTGQHFTLEEYGLVPPYARDKPLVIEDVRSKRELPQRARRRFEELKTRSLIIFPLIARGAWYGVLSLHFKLRRAIDVDDLRHLRGLVDETAIAIDNIRLLAAEAKARREAEQANDLKMKFLAMISHELRTPLTSIKGFATTLLADDVQWHPSSQRDFLHTISEEADKLGDLIEQLLDLSRLEAGILRIVPKAQTLDKIIATAMAQLQTVTADHHLALDVPHDLPLIHVDAQRIAQVLTNLVGNAAKYSPPQTPITLSAHQAGDVLQIDVADQGPGIPPQERVRVFEPFQQLESQASNRTKGAGLGLAICKGLVEAHGGCIWIQDRSAPGTIISFTLPISVTAQRTREDLPATTDHR
jgi:signal transduction histidine kinase